MLPIPDVSTGLDREVGPALLALKQERLFIAVADRSRRLEFVEDVSNNDLGFRADQIASSSGVNKTTIHGRRTIGHRRTRGRLGDDRDGIAK